MHLLDGALIAKPKPSQMRGIQFALQKGSCGIRHSTGMGKSLVAIYSAALALKKNLVDVVYIFHVKAASEAFAGDFKTHTKISPCIVMKKEDWRPGQLFYQVQINRVGEVIDFIMNEDRRIYAVIDEIQALKSPNTSVRHQFDVMRRKFLYVLGLTSTPVGNNIDDLYWIMSYIKSGILNSFWEFRNKYCIMRKRTIKRNGRPFSFQEVTGYKNLDILRDIVSEFWHFETLSMEINYHESSGNLSDLEESGYLEVAKGIVNEEYREFVARLPALQEYVDNTETKLAMVSDLVNKLLIENKGIIVRFVLKSAIQKFQQRIKASTKILTGETSKKEIKEILSWFGPGKVLIVTAAGSRSYNLHAGNQVVFYGVPWELESFSQQIGRVARPLVSTYSYVDVYIPVISKTIDEYRKNVMEVNKDLLLKLLVGGDANLSHEISGIKKQTVINMRKDLLWRLGSVKTNSAKKKLG